MSLLRTRWAAVGAAIAVSLGAGGLGIVNATSSSGERAVFVPITPCRLFDTRPGSDNVGPKSNPMLAGETFTLAVHGSNGNCTGIPADAVSVALNVTALNATEGTFLTIWAADTPRPEASSLNPSPGEPPTPNGVTADLTADGRFSVYNLAGSVDVLADIVGYYVDHNHDDRYVRLPEGSYVVNPAKFASADPADAWTFAGFWAHTAGTNECIFAPLDLPAGRTVTRVVLTYASTAGANPLNASIIAIRHTPGSTSGFAQVLTPTGSTAPATAAGVVAEAAFDLPAGSVVDADRNYTGFVCTDDAFFMLGYRVELA